MKKVGTLERTKAEFLTLRVGEKFIDHRGRIVEKLGDTHVVIGPGYNNDFAIPDYLEAIEAEHQSVGNRYGKYLLPAVNE